MAETMTKTNDNQATQDAKTPSESALLQRLVMPCGVTLYHGDCLEILPTLDCVDAVITDPPYGINLNTDYSWTGRSRKADGYGKGTGKKHRRVNGDNKPFDPSPWLGFPLVVLWGAQNYASKLPDENGWFVWNKRGDGKPSELWFGDCEAAWTNKKGPMRMYHKMWHGVSRWQEEEIIHPTQKPVSLMAWCMDKMEVPKSHTILDPYMGSGSTVIAAIRTGRKVIGIEKDPEHFKNAKEQIERELSQLDLFLA